MGESLNAGETPQTAQFLTPHSTQVGVAVAVLLMVHAGLLAYAATRHSPTLNEPGHLVAGLSHWQFGRFELYRVNPPLSHLVAALPVLAADAETDWGDFFESPGARPVFAIGEDFIAANRERSIWLFTIARWALIPFSVLGGYICFRWASELYSVAAGLLALVLWCFSPNILAHAELVTPDMAATSLGAAAGYMYWRWLKAPTWTSAVVCGVVLGLAELTKFTWVILFGLWPVLWVVWKLMHRKSTVTTHRCLVQGPQLVLQLLLAVYVVNLGYGFEGTATKLGDFQFVSTTLTDSPAASTGKANRFAHTWMREMPVPFPKQYVLGIDVQKRDFEDFGRPSYLRGTFQERGWWYYYLYAATVKIPLGTWALIFISGITSIAAFRRGCGVALADLLVLLAPALVVFTLVSSQTGFSHHFRYVLPCFPFLFIWVSQVASLFRMLTWKSVLAAAALVWSVGASLWYYPHSLSYFNEFAGGPLGGHAHLINSNIDWGQDLLHLKEWLREHPEARPLHFAFYGYYDPADVGIDSVPIPLRPNIYEQKHLPPTKQDPIEAGWYALSVNYVRGYPWRAPREAHAYFQDLQPVATAGYSIYIYHVTAEDARRLP